jgi:hypothetical protein
MEVQSVRWIPAASGMMVAEEVAGWVWGHAEDWTVIAFTCFLALIKSLGS